MMIHEDAATQRSPQWLIFSSHLTQHHDRQHLGFDVDGFFTKREAIPNIFAVNPVEKARFCTQHGVTAEATAQGGNIWWWFSAL